MRYILCAIIFIACSAQNNTTGHDADTAQDIIEGNDTLTEASDLSFEETTEITVDVQGSEVQDAKIDTTLADTLVQTHNWVQKGQGVIPEAFDFRGITGGSAGLYLIGAGPIAYLYSNDKFSDLTTKANNLPPALYAVATDGAGGAFVAGMHGFLSHITRDSWGLGIQCTTDHDCEVSDPCIIGKCTENLCVFDHGTGTNCCGNTHFACDFDSDNCGIQIQDLYLLPNGGITWNRACDLHVKDGAPRSTSGKCALHFGLSDKVCPDDPSKVCPTFDNGNIVAATATTPLIDLPASAKTITLSFQTFIDVEDAEPFDDFSVHIHTKDIDDKKLWDRSDLGIHTSGFKAVTIPLDAYAGKSVQIIFRFNSNDSMMNNGEGVYVDDVSISSICAGDVKGVNLPDTPIFALCSGPQNTVFLGGAGFAGKVENNAVRRINSGKLHDFIGFLSINTGIGVLAFNGDILNMDDASFNNIGYDKLFDLSENRVAVGSNGLILRLADQGVNKVNSPVSTDLFSVFSCDKDTDIAVGKGGRLVKITGSNAVTMSTIITDDLMAVWCKGPNDIWAAGKLGRITHYDGTKFTEFQTKIKGTIMGIAGDGKGNLLAVGESGQASYFDGQAWIQQDSNILKTLWSVVFMDPQNAIAVGEGGTIVTWKNGKWEPVVPVFDRDLYKVSCNGDNCRVLGKGIVLSGNNGVWTSIYAEEQGNIRDCSILGPDNALFVTTRSEVLRFNGKVLTLEPMGAIKQTDNTWKFDESALYGVVIDKDHQLATGADGIELSPDKDGVWQRFGLGQDRTLRDVCITQKGDIFVVGAAGRVIHYYPNKTVHIEDVPGAGNLTGAWCGAGGVAVVGEAGEFYLY